MFAVSLSLLPKLVHTIIYLNPPKNCGKMFILHCKILLKLILLKIEPTQFLYSKVLQDQMCELRELLQIVSQHEINCE